jgi:hypothetical protein
MVENQSDHKLLESLGIPSLAEHTGERTLPWPVDVLLYPWSTSGLVHLLAMTLAVIGIAVGQRWLPGLVRPPGLLSLIPILIALYFTWYLAECVHDSARGGVRAPHILTINPGLNEARSQIAYLVAAGTLYVLPAVVYPLCRQRVDWIFAVLATWAVVFAPIGLLAMVVQDSVDALNPLFLLGSILRTFVPYLGLLILVTGLGGLVWLVLGNWVLSGASAWCQITGVVVIAYGVFVLAHGLGRFYWRYRDRLDWGL